MSRSEGVNRTPRAVVHKRILDAAEERPDASMTELASDISGASVQLVEQVLEEYGDPVGESDPTGEEPAPEMADSAVGDSTESETPAEPDHGTRLSELSEKQRETLRAVRDRVSATQAEIGEALGVSAATVSNRLSEIEGFDWEDRASFVSQLFEPEVIGDGHGRSEDELERRLSALEERLDSVAVDSGDGTIPPELIHKVLHACLESDQIAESEELEIIEALL